MARKKSESPKKMGRPSMYTEELAKEICEQIAMTSVGLNELCKKNSHWPDFATLSRWRDRDDFCQMYQKAKMKQADFLIEEIVTIADDATNDYYTDDDGKERYNSEHVQRSKLRIDTRKWLACKVLPKVYGDKIHVTNDTATVNTTVTDPVEAARIYQKIMQSN